MTRIRPRCKFPWLHLFPVKSYRNFIISIVFYCFRPLWRHNLPNIDMTVLIFSIQPHLTMIHHLWKFHLFSISKTHLKNRGGAQSALPHVWSCSKSPMWGRVNVTVITKEVIPLEKSTNRSNSWPKCRKWGDYWTIYDVIMDKK